MKTSASTNLTRLAIAASLAFAFFHAPLARADDLIYATGSSAVSTVNALNNGDRVLVSGSAGSVTLSSTAFSLAPAGVLAVSDWARADATFTLGATKNNLTFAPASPPAGGAGWAVLESASGRLFNITVAAGGSDTINLDHLILTGATTADAIQTNGGATAMLTIGGPVVFHKNNSTGAGAGIRANTALTFLDAVAFDQNVGGHTISTDAWTATSYGGGLAMLVSANAIFKGDALFSSNTAAFSGGGAYMLGASTANVSFNEAVFEKSARFIGNYAGASGAANSNGGGLYYVGPTSAAFTASLSFLDDLVLDGNSALTGGGLHGAGLIDFNFAGDVTITNNTARDATGGGMNVNDALLVIAPGPAHTVTITGNTAATNGGGIQSNAAAVGVVITAGAITIADNRALAASGTGGGIRAGGSIALTGAFDISGNTAAYGGALAARVIDIVGSGTFSGNTASQRGGAIYLSGSYAGGGARLILTATGGDIVFTGNTAGGTPGSAAVYFDNSAATPGALLSLDAEAGRSILFYDPIYYGTGKVLTVTKIGAGTVLFDRHYQDAAANTTVSDGIFAVTNSATWSRVTGNTFTLAATGTLAGDGAIQAGTITLAAGSHLQAWNGGTLSLNATTRTFSNNLVLSGDGLIKAGAPLNAALVTAGTAHAAGARSTLALADALTIAAGGTLRFDLADSGADLLEVRGGITLAGNATIDLGLLATGSFTIVSWAGATGLGNTGGLALTVNGAAPTARTDIALGVDTAAGALYVTNTTFGLSLKWTGADAGGGATLWADSPSSAANWLDTTSGPSGGTEMHFRAGDSVTFDATAVSRAVSVASTGATASEINITGAADYTFTGSGAITTDAASALAHTRLDGSGTNGKLAKTGAGTATFANSATNRFAGGIEITGGALVFQNPANTVAGGALISGGTLVISTAAQLDTTGAAITFNGPGALRVTANVADTAALPQSLVFSAGQTGTLEIVPPATVAFAGSLAGTGTFAKTGAGTLRVLPAADTASFAGATHIESGTLWLAPGATLAGEVSVAPSANAGGGGVFSGNVSVASGGMLRAGGLSAGGTLTIGGTLALAGNAAVSFNIFNNSNDQLILSSGTAALVAAASNIVNITGDIQSGTYLLGNAVKLADAGVTLKINGQAMNPSLRFTAGLGKTAAGDTLQFTFGADDSRYMNWTTASGITTWDTGLDNWADYDGGVSAPVADKTKFQNRDAVRIATSSDATITISAPVIVSDLVVDNTNGTLAFDGESITGGTAINGNLIAAPAAKLTKTGAGTLLLANTANTFAGGIALHDGVLAFSTAAQLGGADADITFAGSGTLRALADIAALPGAVSVAAGITGALDTGAHTIALTGALTGAGTLAKTGAGTLVYSNVSGGADLSTRVDAGVVELRDFANPAAFAHTFVLNGGWLDLSTNASAANDWAALTLATGAGAVTAGGVIGANDKITLGAGEVGFRIGGDTAAQNGLYVRILAGTGTTVFTGSNTYAGRTIIESGALSVGADNQLGDIALARAVVLAGGTLHVRESFDTARRIELAAAGGAVDVAGSALTTWAGSVGAGALEKTGAGVLALTAALAHDGPTLVSGGTLRARGEFLPGVVEIGNGATLDFAQETAGVFTGTASGAGVVAKTGSAALTINGVLAAREIAIETGALALGSGASVTTASLFRVASGAELRGSGAITLAPGAKLANHGAIRVGHAGLRHAYHCG